MAGEKVLGCGPRPTNTSDLGGLSVGSSDNLTENCQQLKQWVCNRWQSDKNKDNMIFMESDSIFFINFIKWLQEKLFKKLFNYRNHSKQ